MEGSIKRNQTKNNDYVDPLHNSLMSLVKKHNRHKSSDTSLSNERELKNDTDESV